jgi:hypothetical protein
MSLQMKALSLRATNDDIAARASSSRRRRNPFRRRQRRFCGTEASSETKSKEEEEIVIKVFLALRPLDGFPDAFDLYPRWVLHHATVLEMTTSRRDDYYYEEEEDVEKRLQYLVDFAPKHPLALETAFKLLVLRTSVEGVIRHDIVNRKFTKRYASSSGMDLIGEVKRKSVLEAVAKSINSRSSSSNNSGSENSTDDDDDGGNAKNSDDNIREAAYEAVDRVVAAEFYSLCDWRNLALCKNDCRDFHRAFVRYLGEEE